MAQIQKVIAGPATGAGPTLTLAFGSNCTQGNRLLVAAAVVGGTASVTSIQDSLGDVFYKLVDATDGDNTHYSLWEGYVQSSGANSLQLNINTNTPGSVQYTVFAYERDDLARGVGSILDTTAGRALNGSPANPLTSGPSTPAPSASGEFTFALAGDGGYTTTYAANAGWTLLDATGPSGFAHGSTAFLTGGSVVNVSPNASFNASAAPGNCAVLEAVLKYDPRWLPTWLPSLQLLPTR